MKTTPFILAILIFLSINLNAQIIPSGDPNITNILKKIKVDANDRYAIGEANKIKLEANKWLNNIVQMKNDLEQLNQIAKMALKFEDIKNKTEKKIASTQFEIIEIKLDAIESFELSNDIVFAFIKKYKNQVISKLNKETVKNFDNLMKKSVIQWDKAKGLRQKGYELTNDKESLEMLVTAQKTEDEVIAKIEKEITSFYSIDYLPGNAVYYAMFFDNNSEKLNSSEITENNQKPIINFEAGKSEIKNSTISNKEKNVSVITNSKTYDYISKNISYKIQVGAFLKQADESAFRGINPIVTEKNQEGFTRYLAGEYNSRDVAIYALKILKDTGFNDAFLVAYDNGVRLQTEPQNKINSNLAKK